MRHLFSDPQTWIDNFWLPLLGTAVVGVAGLVGWWFKTRGQRRYEASANGKLKLSRDFTAAATQIAMMRRYGENSTSLSNDQLAGRFDFCFHRIFAVVYGDAAKAALNADETTFGVFETDMVSMTVGNLENLVKAYVHLQQVHDADPLAPAPVQAIDLHKWEKAYRFASKVVDPNQTTLLGYLRLGNRMLVLMEGIYEATGAAEHPGFRKSNLWRRIRCLLTRR